MVAITSNGANDLFESKWKKLLSRVWLFDLIPFVDFVFVAGSMAMGNIDEDSDFDVIVGVKRGRIFTARAFCVVFFGLLGWRRKRGADKRGIKDRFCFNHFVAPERYCLSEPRNDYWKKLYLSLAPVYGKRELIQKFYDANAGWTGPVRNSPPKRLFGPRLRAGAVSNGMEWLLSGRFGDFFESKLKNIQIKKIEKSLKTENLYKPRIIYNNSELEFHPDTKRTGELLNNRKF